MQIDAYQPIIQHIQNMSKKRIINLIANIFAPSAVIIVTIVLFFVFGSEETGELFWSNLIFTIFFEVIFFAYTTWFPIFGTSIALKWVCGINTTIYLSSAIIWMLTYSIVLRNLLPLKVYFSIMAVITTLWIVLGAISFKADSKYSDSLSNIEKNRKRVDRVNEKGELFLNHFNNLTEGYPELISISDQVKTFCYSLKTLSPAVMSMPDVVRNINAICDNFEKTISGHITDISSAKNKIRECAEISLLQLNNLKKAIRK